MFDIFYKKNDNNVLFKDLEKNDFSNLTKLQSFIFYLFFIR